jgi:hypothetical protein
MATATYVYCLAQSARKPTSAGVPAGLPGASAPAVAEVGDRVWLVHAEVPLDRYGESTLASAIKDLEWVSRVAVAHESVVEHFAALRGTTVIPMKLFTMFSGTARAVADVRKRRRVLMDVFARLAGCEEWGLRVLRSGVKKGSARSASGTRPATGSAFLAARKQARDEAREALVAAATAAEQAYSSLARMSREHRRRSGESPGVVAPLLDAAFLVPVRSRARFKSAAGKAARTIADAGAAMTLTGPWPPYNFVAPPDSQEIS